MTLLPQVLIVQMQTLWTNDHEKEEKQEHPWCLSAHIGAGKTMDGSGLQYNSEPNTAPALSGENKLVKLHVYF